MIVVHCTCGADSHDQEDEFALLQIKRMKYGGS